MLIMKTKIEKWNLSGKQKRIKLNKHTITIIDAVPKKNILSLAEGQEKLRKILLEAE